MDGETVEAWIVEQIQKMMFAEQMDFAYHMHEGMWGVPCGPTLTMIYPTELKGIQTIVSSKSLCEPCDKSRIIRGQQSQVGQPCDICNGTGTDYIGRPCRHCSERN